MLRLNPIYKKELKQNARISRSAIMLFFYNALLTLFGLFALFVIFNSNQKKGYSVYYSDILKIYGIIVGMEFVFVLFIIPAMTAGAIAGEREKQTLEILLTTKVSELQIILGKLASSISMMLLLAFSSLPIISIVFSVGGITLVDLVEIMILIIVTAIFLGSIGIYFSALCKKTTGATVCTYMTVLFITGGLTLFLIGAGLLNDVQLYTTTSSQSSYMITSKYGDSILLLLINPLFSFLSLLHRQTGIGSNMESLWDVHDKLRYGIANYWFECSSILQILISAILLFASSKLLKSREVRIIK